MMNPENRRLGHFRLFWNVIAERSDEVAEVFHKLKIVPIKASYRVDLKAVEYLAISSLFDEIRDHEPAPEYIITVHKDEHGKIVHCSFEKRQPQYKPNFSPKTEQIRPDQARIERKVP
jgi:hypothetical protein